MVMEGSAPSRLPYAIPTITVATHSVVMLDTLMTAIWDIMNREDTIHRLYARDR